MQRPAAPRTRARRDAKSRQPKHREHMHRRSSATTRRRARPRSSSKRSGAGARGTTEHGGALSCAQSSPSRGPCGAQSRTRGAAWPSDARNDLGSRRSGDERALVRARQRAQPVVVPAAHRELILHREPILHCEPTFHRMTNKATHSRAPNNRCGSSRSRTRKEGGGSGRIGTGGSSVLMASGFRGELDRIACRVTPAWSSGSRT